MGDWVVGALINLVGSVAINLGTNLLKLGHNEREKNSFAGIDGGNGKAILKPIIYFQAWRTGLLVFFLGNCLNFMSFGYAAQSLLSALGSIQFISNVAFAYFVFKRTVTIKVLVATVFIVLGNVFLVAFGNHQSPVYTPEQLEEKYNNITFVLYCTILTFVVAIYYCIYRRGILILATPGKEVQPYWQTLLPFSYAVVSGAIGSFSVLFAKSLSNLLRLTMTTGYSLHNWFTYSLLLFFLCTAGFWMTRLNEGLSLFDAILIVPMFQIVWTFFSICTGFVYFQEYQVLDTLRATMFLLGMMSVFIGISLLAPDESKGSEIKDSAALPSTNSPEAERLVTPSDDLQPKDLSDVKFGMGRKILEMMVKTKTACCESLGFGEDSINASAVLVMPMVSSKMTAGFRGALFDRPKLFSLRSSRWRKISMEEEEGKFRDPNSLPLHVLS